MKLLQDFNLLAVAIRNPQEPKKSRIGLVILMLCSIGFIVSIVLTFVALYQAFSISQVTELPPACAFWLGMMAIFATVAVLSQMLWNTKKES